MTLEEILSTALDKGVTDVHIVQSNQSLSVHQRILGKLYKISEFPYSNGLINRIKVQADLDLSETRRSQEGQFLFKENSRSTFIRVSIIKTVRGEKLALRLLPEKNQIPLNELGIPSSLYAALSHAMSGSNGLILVCGATGAGKSTTLYSCLDTLNTGNRSIYTIEDPVEHEIPGIFQCEPNQAIGMDSASLLKAFLRQDPDIIMVGEVRDAITANLAINAALTGHLVFTTLHTNSALDAMHRCRNWNVDFFSLASSLKLIIHQSMSYQNGIRHPIFNGLAPIWDTQPKDYNEITSTPSLWKALSNKKEDTYAMV